MAQKHASIGHRAWFAYCALTGGPATPRPSKRSLEVKYGLSNKDLSRLIWDFYERPSYEKMQRFAAALGTTAEWLDREEGPGPFVDWVIPSRPAAPKGMLKKTKSGSIKKVVEG
jgi:hypothetical protein